MSLNTDTLYITGAGVSSESGIPTFRGEDGFWTVGSINYTPLEMATREMYMNNPDEFLLWYYKRFAAYREAQPNSVHKWLKNKNLITQNIDGLDGKAGNCHYIPIHGRLDKVTKFHEQGQIMSLLDAPWDDVAKLSCEEVGDKKLKKILLEAFKISKQTLKPEFNHSLKPFVLLFDEFYTELYRLSEAEQRMHSARRVVFIGTSLSVNITNIALQTAINNSAKIDIVDPHPADLGYKNISYHKMTAKEYITSQN